MTSTQHRPSTHAEVTIQADPTVPAVHIVRDFAATPDASLPRHSQSSCAMSVRQHFLHMKCEPR